MVFAQEEPLSLLGGGATTAVGYMSDSGTAEAPNEEVQRPRMAMPTSCHSVVAYSSSATAALLFIEKSERI